MRNAPLPVPGARDVWQIRTKTRVESFFDSGQANTRRDQLVKSDPQTKVEIARIAVIKIGNDWHRIYLKPTKFQDEDPLDQTRNEL